eukprot:203619_1
MILVISTFTIFPIITFTIISHMDFSQMRIQSTITTHHSNPYHHIYPIKSHTNLLNNQLQQPTTCTQKPLKIHQKFNEHYKYSKISPLLHLIYHMMWILTIFIINFMYFITLIFMDMNSERDTMSCGILFIFENANKLIDLD